MSHTEDAAVFRRWRGYATVATLLSIGLAILGYARGRFSTRVRTWVDEVHASARVPVDRRYSSDDVGDVPAPVRRYFDRVLEEGQPYVVHGRLRQHGELRLGGADAAWVPLRATQHVGTDPPGFVWDATVVVASLFPVRVFDAYRRGDGRLRARLLGAIPVASAGPSVEMNRGELVRYLAEGVWFPTALLPSAGVEWEAIDDGSARATLEDHDVTASVVFHFDEHDEIARVTTVRYRQETDEYLPWVGSFGEYEDHDGVRVPTEAAVAWSMPAGEVPYWRATIDEITYRPARSNLREA